MTYSSEPPAATARHRLLCECSASPRKSSPGDTRCPFMYRSAFTTMIMDASVQRTRTVDPSLSCGPLVFSVSTLNVADLYSLPSASIMGPSFKVRMASAAPRANDISSAREAERPAITTVLLLSPLRWVMMLWDSQMVLCFKWDAGDEPPSISNTSQFRPIKPHGEDSWKQLPINSCGRVGKSCSHTEIHAHDVATFYLIVGNTVISETFWQCWCRCANIITRHNVGKIS